MDFFSQKELKKLSNKRQGPYISLYIKTKRQGKETRKNSIKLKSAIKKARELLRQDKLNEDKIDKLLKPLEKLQLDNTFWNHQSDGLALFVAEDYFSRFRLPINLKKEDVVVSDRFYLKPLIKYLSTNGRFYLLTLSQKKVQLFECTRGRISRLSPDALPKNLEEALHEDPEKQLQFHTKVQPHRGNRPGIHHGQGLPDDHQKNKIKRYFSKINKGIKKLFEMESRPLILAAVDYLHPIYEEVNSYSNLLDKGIQGNTDKIDKNKLHKKAYEIVKSEFVKLQDKTIKKYQNLKNTDLATTKLEKIINASAAGKVDTLFLLDEEYIWGVYNPNTGAVYTHAKQKPESHDLLDLAAAQTLSTNADVFVMSKDEMPENSKIAAILRK